MFDVLQVLCTVFVVVAMVPSLAHALEFPGKLRLGKDAYFAVQRIYYPGFTIAGISEPVAIISTAILLLLTPAGTVEFRLTLLTVIGLITMHATYWLFTHRVNNFWLKDKELSDIGSGFFSFGGGKKRDRPGETRSLHWAELRDRWEYSHLARAGLAAFSFVALVIAISSKGL